MYSIYCTLAALFAECSVWCVYFISISDKHTLLLPYRQANSVRDAAIVKLTGYNREHSRTHRHIKPTLACAVKPAES